LCWFAIDLDFEMRIAREKELNLLAPDIRSRASETVWAGLQQCLSADYGIIPVTDGMSGASVFRIRKEDAPDRFLKIAEGDAAGGLRCEIERTRWLSHRGFRVPVILNECVTQDSAAVLMSAVPGHPISTVDDLPAVAHALARLHAVSSADCPFNETINVRLGRALRAIECNAIDADAFDGRNRGVAPRALYERLIKEIPAECDEVIVHGDATLSNILVDGDTGAGFIDCSRCGRADRYTDLAIICYEIEMRFGADAKEIFIEAYGLSQWDAQKARFFLDLYELF
jgi:aminoglycoside phosphotransferase